MDHHFPNTQIFLQLDPLSFISILCKHTCWDNKAKKPSRPFDFIKLCNGSGGCVWLVSETQASRKRAPVKLMYTVEVATTLSVCICTHCRIRWHLGLTWTTVSQRYYHGSFLPSCNKKYSQQEETSRLIILRVVHRRECVCVFLKAECGNKNTAAQKNDCWEPPRLW